MIVVGSTAAKYWWSDWREPSDLDLWVCNIEHDFGDIHIIPEHILRSVPTITDDYAYATPDALYTIKCSHLGWDNPMWEKHKQDVLVMKAKGCEIIPELYQKLIDHWKHEFGAKEFLSLKQSKEQFFTDKVNYLYDHDYLHELVAYPNRPMYEATLRDGEAVLTSYEKFCKLCFKDRVRMFREEITVIACERWLLNPYWQERNISWWQSYIWSLKKTITNLTKNWATDFIVQNLEEFITPDFSYFKHLMEELSIMSNVDLKVFEDLLNSAQTNTDSSADLDSMIYAMCEGDVYAPSSCITVSEPERNGRDWSDESYRAELQSYWDEMKRQTQAYLDSIGYEHLEQEGGGEGGSEYCYGVFKLGGKIYRAEYSYYSYNGHEYDGISSTLCEVTPVEKTITVYE